MEKEVAERIYAYLKKVAEKNKDKYTDSEFLLRLCRKTGYQFEDIIKAFRLLRDTNQYQVDVCYHSENKIGHYAVHLMSEQERIDKYESFLWFDSLPDKPETPEEAIKRVEAQRRQQWTEEYKQKRIKKVGRKQSLGRKIKLYVEQDGKCRYCNDPFEVDEMTFDHVHPRSKGGSNGKDNLVLACKECNQKKADKLLEEFIKEKELAIKV